MKAGNILLSYSGHAKLGKCNKCFCFVVTFGGSGLWCIGTIVQYNCKAENGHWNTILDGSGSDTRIEL